MIAEFNLRLAQESEQLWLDPLWWIQSVYVKEAFRRQGVFRALFKHLENLARAHKEVRGLRLYMHADNFGARQSYESLGMKPTKYEVFEMDLDRGHS